MSTFCRNFGSNHGMFRHETKGHSGFPVVWQVSIPFHESQGSSSGKFPWIHFCILGSQNSFTVFEFTCSLNRLMLMPMVTNQTVQSIEQRGKSCQDCHALFHRHVVFRIYQVPCPTHVELTRLSMFMNFCKVSALKHQRLLGFVPNESDLHVQLGVERVLSPRQFGTTLCFFCFGTPVGDVRTWRHLTGTMMTRDHTPGCTIFV